MTLESILGENGALALIPETLDNVVDENNGHVSSVARTSLKIQKGKRSHARI